MGYTQNPNGRRSPAQRALVARYGPSPRGLGPVVLLVALATILLS